MRHCIDQGEFSLYRKLFDQIQKILSSFGVDRLIEKFLFLLRRTSWTHIDFELVRFVRGEIHTRPVQPIRTYITTDVESVTANTPSSSLISRSIFTLIRRTVFGRGNRDVPSLVASAVCTIRR